MADRGYVASLLRQVPNSSALRGIFDYVLRNIRVGLPGHQKPAENFQWIQLNGTTPATANAEFAIAHGLGAAPSVAFPCLDLQTAGNEMPQLGTARSSDDSYIYLYSPSTSVSFTVFVEAR